MKLVLPLDEPFEETHTMRTHQIPAIRRAAHRLLLLGGALALAVQAASAADTNRPEATEIPPGEPTAAAPEALRIPQTPPTPHAVEEYRRKLEDRLLERYANLPEYAGRVSKVTVILSKPIEYSVDGGLIRAEFDQLVHDAWGKRLTDLEREYYVVTFGSGGVAEVRADPSVRVGLDLEKTYSEKAPPVSDPFRNIEDNEAFSDAPTLKMPQWWRPDFPEPR